MSPIDVDEDPAVSICFSVEIKPHHLGVFTSCEGLGIEIVVEPREEGGNNDFVHQLPVRFKYSNIKLTRPLNSHSVNVANWFASMAGNLEYCDATISAMRADRSIVTSWTLRRVIPVRWQGPSLNVETNKVATETLELAHHGFLKVR